MPRLAGHALVVTLVVSFWSVSFPASSASAGDDPPYEHPVVGEVVEPFRPPDRPYGPGNRGLDYATEAGAPVGAAADGLVVWAGPVGGSLHVTVLHPDGLRTSYSFLAGIAVQRGQSLIQGELLGWSSGRIHVGVRDGDDYLDPAELFGRTGPPMVRLVPLDGSALAASPPVAERRHLFRLSLPDLSAPGLPVGLPGPGSLPSLGGPLLGQALNPLSHYATELWPGTRQYRVLRHWAARWLDPPDCTPPEAQPPEPSERRIAVLVGGLGTTSEEASIDRVDTDSLGYAARDVLRFSYAGGRTPAGSPVAPLSDLEARPYDAEDSQQDLTVVADRLLDLLGQIAAREPGVPIDVLAHSQGGVVVQWALAAGGSRSVPESVDLVVTLGSPHDGTDLATGAAALNALPRGRAGLSWIGERLDLGLRPDAASIQQLSETSELMAILDDTAVPASVRVLTIGARGDLIVPAGHTRLPGAAHHVVDLTGRDAHTRLPGDDATTREIGLGLAGMAPTCEGAWDTLGDLALSEGISWSEDALALSALTLTGP